MEGQSGVSIRQYGHRAFLLWFIFCCFFCICYFLEGKSGFQLYSVLNAAIYKIINPISFHAFNETSRNAIRLPSYDILSRPWLYYRNLNVAFFIDVDAAVFSLQARVMCKLEIDRYGFFGADTDTSAIHGTRNITCVLPTPTEADKIGRFWPIPIYRQNPNIRRLYRSGRYIGLSLEQT